MVPDPATLSWLLRKASLDVVHERRIMKRTRDQRELWNEWVKAQDRRDKARGAQRWLADIIREQQ